MTIKEFEDGVYKFLNSEQSAVDLLDFAVLSVQGTKQGCGLGWVDVSECIKNALNRVENEKNPDALTLIRYMRGKLDDLESILSTKSLNEPDSLPWIEYGNQDFGDHFSEVMIKVNRPLEMFEVTRISGCIGYAFREIIRGEELSLPKVINFVNNITILEYYYDSTKTQSDDPDFDTAFEKAIQYIHEGTPIRKTDRAGAGTKGTRLVEGIGGTPKIKMYCR